MKHLVVLSLLALACLCTACSTSGSRHTAERAATSGIPVPVDPGPGRQTVLLVSLEDGSVVMQRIDSSADICFKSNSDSATTCLTQGAPVTSPLTDEVIGYEMIEERIDLVAKSN